ncbi:bifunctional ornithine acetyltransferase/N-acetylglutamate synthase [Sphingomonas sp. MMS24-JH45]
MPMPAPSAASRSTATRRRATPCSPSPAGAAGNAPLARDKDPGADAFRAALADLCRQLALLVVRDGEGATKLIEVTVDGAESDRSAHRIAMSIANSPLVKTAIAGEDANWGRVVVAGKAGEPAERDRLAIRFGATQVAEDRLRRRRLRQGAGRRASEGAGVRDRGGPRHRRGQRAGCRSATSPTGTSRSMRIIVADRAEPTLAAGPPFDDAPRFDDRDEANSPPRGGSTRNELKRAARRLFAERGIAAVGMREVVEAAGQRNAAAVHLSRQQGRPAAGAADRRRRPDRRRPARAVRRGGGGRPPGCAPWCARTSCRASSSPARRASARPISASSSTSRTSGTARRPRHRTEHSPGYARYLAHVQRLLAPLPPAIVNQRLLLAGLSLQTLLAAREAAMVGDTGDHHFEEFGPRRWRG